MQAISSGSTAMIPGISGAVQHYAGNAGAVGPSHAAAASASPAVAAPLNKPPTAAPAHPAPQPPARPQKSPENADTAQQNPPKPPAKKSLSLPDLETKAKISRAALNHALHNLANAKQKWLHDEMLKSSSATVKADEENAAGWQKTLSSIGT